MMQRTIAECDMGCDHGGAKVEGVMFFAAGATGRICPVLFQCRATAGEANFLAALPDPPEGAFVFVAPW